MPRAPLKLTGARKAGIERYLKHQKNLYNTSELWELSHVFLVPPWLYPN